MAAVNDAHRPPSARFASLDSLRGVAVLLVVVAHLISPRGDVLSRMLVAVGVHGVDLFFALSGFLIGGILLEHKSSPRLIRTFYARRAGRILPVYGLLLVSFVAGQALDARFNFGLAPYFYLPPGTGWGFALLLQNLTMAGINAMLPTWLMVTWSLAAEEQFYLAAPWLTRVFSTRTITILCLAAMVACPVLRYVFVAHGSWVAAAILLICRADSICVGVLIAVVYRTGVLDRMGPLRLGLVAAVLGILAVGVTCATGSLLTAESHVAVLVWQPTLWALSGMSLVALLVTLPPDWEVGLLSYAGKTSYFVYLFHLPAILVGLTLAGKYHVNYLAACSGCLALTWGLAEVSWRVMEKPCQDFVRGRFKY